MYSKPITNGALGGQGHLKASITSWQTHYIIVQYPKLFLVHTGRRSVAVIKVLDVFLCFRGFAPAPTESVIRIQYIII